MSCGIYKIENLINHKKYIGQSVDIKRRWINHKVDSKKEQFSKYPLYKAFKKYGIQNFQFTVIEECSKNQLNQKQKYWISYFDSYNNGYNQTTGGDGSTNNVIKLTKQNIQEIYDLLINTNIPQYQIAKKFSVGEDTISEINQGKTRIKEQFSYPLRKNHHKYFCKKCGKLLKYKAQYCRECISIINRKVERPSRNQLKTLIRTLPFTTIAKQFNVSDNAIRKWCNSENLPRTKKEIKSYSDEEWEKI